MTVLDAPGWLPADATSPCTHRITADSVQNLPDAAAATRDTTPHASPWIWLIGQSAWPHPDRAPRLVNRITSGTRSLYPPLHFRVPFDQTAWVEADSAHTIARAYAALIRLHAAELVQLVILPADSTPAECAQTLSALEDAMVPLTEAAAERIPPTLIRAITEHRHYTHSERLILERLCQRHRALYGQWPDADLCRQDTARATLTLLEQHLLAFETHYT